MSGGLRHHSDEATGPESCGWIKRHRKKYRYYLEQTSASALRGSYAPGLQKQSSMYVNSADVVKDVDKQLVRQFIFGVVVNVLRHIAVKRQDVLQVQRVSTRCPC